MLKNYVAHLQYNGQHLPRERAKKLDLGILVIRFKIHIEAHQSRYHSF